MTRVSLKEAYDNKDVVAQIYAIRDIAEGAEDTANGAVTTANTASEHVDSLVPQVEGAVQTVAGYENRLSTVESDLNAVTLRVTTAEGQIVTIQGRVTALETADGQNVKLTGVQTIGGVKHFADSPTAPTTTTGLWDVQVANGEKVKNELDNYSPMVRTTGNQLSIAGDKGFLNSLTALPRNIFNALGWTNIFNINATSVYVFIMFSGSNVLLCQLDGHSAARVLVIGNTARPYPDTIKIAHNQVTGEYEVWFNAQYGAWVRGFMISEGSGNSVGEPAHYVAKNIRGNEPVIDDTYDEIVVSSRWGVVA